MSVCVVHFNTTLRIIAQGRFYTGLAFRGSDNFIYTSLLRDPPLPVYFTMQSTIGETFCVSFPAQGLHENVPVDVWGVHPIPFLSFGHELPPPPPLRLPSLSPSFSLSTFILFSLLRSRGVVRCHRR